MLCQRTPSIQCLQKMMISMKVLLFVPPMVDMAAQPQAYYYLKQIENHHHKIEFVINDQICVYKYLFFNNEIHGIIMLYTVTVDHCMLGGYQSN